MALYDGYLPEIRVPDAGIGGPEAEEAFAIAVTRAGLHAATHGRWRIAGSPGHPVWESFVSPAGAFRPGQGRQLPLGVDFEPASGCLHCRLG